MLPAIDLDNDRVTVDPTWGEVQPMHLHPEIETIGELELIAHIGAGGRLVDTRRQAFVEGSGTIADATPIEADAIVDHLDELAGDDRIVVFCNGPQCAATPRAVEHLLAAGFPPSRLLYYRGGIHDWATLGYPLVSVT